MSVTFSGGGVTISGGGWTLSPPPLGFLLYSIGGYNAQGQLGLNDTVNRSSPVQVGTTNNWDNIDTNYYFSTATRKDGTLWTWGNGSWGVLGLNDTTSKSSPTQVGALTTWSKVNAGTYFTLAIKTDGTLWAWGRNDLYQLGLGNTISRSSPVQVGAGTTWLNVTAGYGKSLATTTDGKLYAWGRNYYGELGLNTQGGYKSVPTQVGALTNWVSVICKDTSTYAIKSDGTLWAWGKNSVGQLGDNTSISRSSPVQVGLLNTWLNVGAGEYGGAAATQTNGKLFTWGYNSSGSMGRGAFSNNSSPVQVGTDTNWSQVAYNFDTVAATKTTGTLWTWGYNNKGQLGQNNLIYRSSPTQVGTNTGWLKVSVSNKYNIIGILGDPLS